jgi:hypothetical protein
MTPLHRKVRPFSPPAVEISGRRTSARRPTENPQLLLLKIDASSHFCGSPNLLNRINPSSLAAAAAAAAGRL